MAKELHVKSLHAYSDSAIVVNQMNDNFQTKEKVLALYVTEARRLTKAFGEFRLEQISKERNGKATN